MKGKKYVEDLKSNETFGKYITMIDSLIKPYITEYIPSMKAKEEAKRLAEEEAKKLEEEKKKKLNAKKSSDEEYKPVIKRRQQGYAVLQSTERQHEYGAYNRGQCHDRMRNRE